MGRRRRLRLRRRRWRWRRRRGRRERIWDHLRADDEASHRDRAVRIPVHRTARNHWRVAWAGTIPVRLVHARPTVGAVVAVLTQRRVGLRTRATIIAYAIADPRSRARIAIRHSPFVILAVVDARANLYVVVVPLDVPVDGRRAQIDNCLHGAALRVAVRSLAIGHAPASVGQLAARARNHFPHDPAFHCRHGRE